MKLFCSVGDSIIWYCIEISYQPCIMPSILRRFSWGHFSCHRILWYITEWYYFSCLWLVRSYLWFCFICQCFPKSKFSPQLSENSQKDWGWAGPVTSVIPTLPRRNCGPPTVLTERKTPSGFLPDYRHLTYCMLNRLLLDQDTRTWYDVPLGVYLWRLEHSLS